MSRIEKVSAVKAFLQKLLKKAVKDNRASVTVGFTQSYALKVHENTEAHHNVGEAKYLEGPARTFSKTIATIVRETTKQTGSMLKGLLLGGLRLQREAQLRAPVDTGALKASAFTCETKFEEAEAARVSSKAEQIAQKAAKRRKKKKK